MNSLELFTRHLSQLNSSGSKVNLEPGSNNYMVVGYETVTPSTGYFWDGLKRSADPQYPFIIFQYTLSGYGCYSEGGNTYKMLPKMAFSATVPSEHIYYLPRESDNWTFFFFIFNHPYIVSRINQQKKEWGAIITIEPDQ